MLHFFQQVRVVLGGRAGAAVEAQAEFTEKLAEVAELLDARLFVDAVQCRHLVAQQVACRGDVGRQHAFLDDAVRVVAHQRHDPGELAVIVETEARLDGVEIDRATFVARGVQQPVQAVEVVQMRQQRGMALAQLGIVIAQHLADLVVGQARMRVHDRIEEARPEQLAVAIEIQLGGHAQAVDVRIQRAQAVRQDLGQHRDHAIGEIDRIAAPVGLVVERAARDHVRRHIGDRDQQPPALGRAFTEHRVIEVARVGAIDRDQRGTTQVDTPALRRLRHLGQQAVDLGQQLVRPVLRDIVRTDRDVGCHARGQMIAEDLGDLAERLTPRLRVLGDVYHRHLAVARPAQPVRCDQDLLRDPLVVGQQERDAGLDLQAADDVLERALQHLDDRGLAAAAAVDTGDARDDAVTVPQAAHLARAQEQVVAALVRMQEAESVRMADDPTVDQVLVVDDAVTAAPVAYHLAVARHGVETTRQRILALRIVETQCSGELVERQRRAVCFHRRQDEFTTRDRVGVLLGLARLVGIAMAAGAAGFAFCHVSGSLCGLGLGPPL